MSAEPDLFSGLTAVVQYRRTDSAAWHSMAAFDSRSIADQYAKDCAGTAPPRPWEYRVVDAPAHPSGEKP